MNLLLLKSAACIFLTVTASLAIAGPEPVADDWHANLQIPTGTLTIIVTITEDDSGELTAHLESPDQAPGQLIPISEVSVVDDHLSIAIKMLGASIEAVWDDDEQHWAGTFSQGMNLPIVLVRGLPAEKPAAETRNRPQEPTEPYGYLVEEVSYENPEAEGVTLAGTLTLPEGNGPFAAAILISGSGPQDRNEEVFGHRPFLVLADHLTKQGIAVLRYDDRGVAKSTGDFSAATSADFATDANAAFAFLKSRPEIDHDAIGFIGHSEGGIIAPIAIQDNNQIAYMVMLAGPGTSSQQISRSQRRLIALSQGATEEDIAQNEKINSAISHAAADAASTEDATDMIRAILTPEAMETLGINETQAETVIAQSTTPWVRYFLGYDPVGFVPQITIPILALNGELDLQVPAQENLDGLRAMLKEHPDATITELEGLNHMFQHATTGALSEYNEIEETFSREAMGIIADWINKRFGSN